MTTGPICELLEYFLPLPWQLFGIFKFSFCQDPLRNGGGDKQQTRKNGLFSIDYPQGCLPVINTQENGGFLVLLDTM